MFSVQLAAVDNTEKWARYLDKTSLTCAALVPLGIAIGNAGFESMIALAGIAWLIRSIILKCNPFLNVYKKQAVIAWFAWLTIIILSMIINGPGGKGAAHDIVFIRFFLFACAMIDLSYRREVSKHLVRGLAIGILFGAFNMLVCYIFGFDFFGHDLTRYTGKLKEAARLAGLCSMAFPFIALWCIATFSFKNKYSWGLCIVSLTSIIVLYQTTIRTALIASLASIFIGIFIYRYKRMKLVELILWILALFVGPGCAYFLMKTGDLSSFYDRIGIWKVAFAMWKENSLFGVGVSSFSETFTVFSKSGQVLPYIDPTGKAWLKPVELHSHNLLLMLLSSTGFLGLLSFLWLFVCCCIALLKSKVPWVYGLYTWPFTFMIVGLTGWNIYSSWFQALFSFFAVLAITSGIESTKKEVKSL